MSSVVNFFSFIIFLFLFAISKRSLIFATILFIDFRRCAARKFPLETAGNVFLKYWEYICIVSYNEVCPLRSRRRYNRCSVLIVVWLTPKFAHIRIGTGVCCLSPWLRVWANIPVVMVIIEKQQLRASFYLGNCGHKNIW